MTRPVAAATPESVATAQLPRLAVSDEEAGAMLGLSRSTIQALLNSGGLPFVAFGRATRINVEDLRAYLVENAARRVLTPLGRVAVPVKAPHSERPSRRRLRRTSSA